MPVIPPLGFDGEGRACRVNSDAAAVEVGEELSAAKIVYLAPSSAFAGHPTLARQLSVSETLEMVKKQREEFSQSIVSKLECAARACVQGVPRVRIFSMAKSMRRSLPKFSRRLRTMVYSNEYQQIRRIFKKDVRAVMSLIRQSVRNEAHASNARRDSRATGIIARGRPQCGCLRPSIYPQDAAGELACLYVNKAHENQGYGQKLMAFAENRAPKGLKRLFALSTQAFSYLQQKRFIEGSAEDLPAERRLKYEASGRNSKILFKPIAAGIN